MADRVLVMTWQHPVRGKEERAVEVFTEALGILGRMQQDGRIERFDVMLLQPNGDLGGVVTAYGTAEQIVAMRADDAFQRNTIEAQICVEGVRHVEGYANEGVAQRMTLYQEALSRAPQRA